MGGEAIISASNEPVLVFAASRATGCAPYPTPWQRTHYPMSALGRPR